MALSKEEKKFELVAQKIASQSTLLRTWTLTGGASSRVTVLEILLCNGQTKKVIVRQHGETHLTHHPHAAADEFRLLQELHPLGLSVPQPYYCEESVFSTPCIVMEFMEGQTEFVLSSDAGFIVQMAKGLAMIHKVDCSGGDFSFLPELEKFPLQNPEKTQKPEKHSVMDESMDEGYIRNILSSVRPFRRNSSVFLHGDFWPGNILWKDGQLVGIIDWEDAALGDPLADVARSRLEILWAFGMQAMEDFTHAYKSIMANTDFADLAYWDLRSALKAASAIATWGLGDKKRKQCGSNAQCLLPELVKYCGRWEAFERFSGCRPFVHEFYNEAFRALSVGA